MPCPTGFLSNQYYASVNNYNPFYCYQVFAGQFDFFTTRNKCNNLVPGSSLIRIKTSTDYYYMLQYRNSYANSVLWVDSFRNTITNYTWGDGTALDYSYFCNGQPDSGK